LKLPFPFILDPGRLRQRMRRKETIRVRGFKWQCEKEKKGEKDLVRHSQ